MFYKNKKSGSSINKSIHINYTDNRPLPDNNGF